MRNVERLKSVSILLVESQVALPVPQATINKQWGRMHVSNVLKILIGRESILRVVAVILDSMGRMGPAICVPETTIVPEVVNCCLAQQEEFQTTEANS